MRLEFVYIILAIVFSFVYYTVMKKKIFGRHEHSYVLMRGMKVNLVFNIVFLVLCIITLLTTDGVASGLEVKYSLDLFRFLLRTPKVTTRALVWMNVAVYIFEIVTMVVGAKISVKRKGHKNLKLEKTLTSDCVACAACTFLATLEMGLCLLLFI